MTMEMSSAQWLSALGMEDPLLVRQCSRALTEEQLRVGAMMHLPSTNFDSTGTRNPMKHHNIPAMDASGFHCGVMSSESLTAMGYERPLKVPKTNNCHLTSMSAQSPNPLTFSSSSVYMPNPPLQNFQLTQHQHPLPQRPDSYITSLPQLKDEIYEAVAPTTPTMQGEIMVSLASAGNDQCISDINNGMDGFNFFGGKGSNKQLAVAETGAAATALTLNNTSPVQNKRSGHTHDHIMAERKRRERLSQRFIALSAIVPGLKKMDKASVLDDAIKYVKKLQERLNVLEQQTSKKTVQSVVYVNKSPPAQTENPPGGSVAGDDYLLPEIEARVVDKSVLIRIHCEKRKGLLVNVLGELEKLHLTVVNASILSFSETSLDLTLNAQMEEGCELTVTDIMRTLEALFKRTP